MKSKVLKICRPFSEQYTMYIDTDLYGVNVKMESKTKLRWDFTVISISEEEIEVRLLLLDHILLYTDNPIVKETATMTQVFSRMYNELHLIIDQSGTIRKILNLHVVRDKWKDVKKEMLAIAERTPDIKNAIQLHDSIFNDESRLIQGIQYGEFFMIYFNKFFNKNLPKAEVLTGTNWFNTANVTWRYTYEITRDYSNSDKNIILEMKGFPSGVLGAGFYQRAYFQFSQMKDIGKLTTELNESAKYEIEEETGRLIQARIYRNEIADSDLYMKLTYTLMCEQILKDKLQKEQELDAHQTELTIE
ncbi:hypothetical protein [Chryseobacterium camelliae]|uniref:hypothetical protein n=1 Tax=Chryseobacterium camelliae TaxID=1265445 RepID=UPI0028602047|nr:hypothetical protein [Chryseobacterium camelliae]MDR6513779.1 hypothetical protein [Chryseobacterium camelliae]